MTGREHRDYRWLKAADGHTSGMTCGQCDYRIDVALLPARTDRERVADAHDRMLEHYAQAHDRPDHTA